MPRRDRGRDAPRCASPRRSERVNAKSEQLRARSVLSRVAFDHDLRPRSAIVSPSFFSAPLRDRRAPTRGTCPAVGFSTMTNACQSPSTLDEMLREAAGRLARSVTLRARDLTERIDELQRTIREEGTVSSQAEQEIVSIYVLSELETSRRS
jgi:hypothetical protein